MIPEPTQPLGAWVNVQARCREWTKAVAATVTRRGWVLSLSFFIVLLTGGVELGMGRSLLGPDGKFEWWEGSIWSNACSQRLVDPYSFSHIAHGILFYGLLWFVARKLPVSSRLLFAVLLEAAWEIMENSPLIIERYRQTTIALGYEGDSVLNSLSDVVMMSLGFLMACRLRPYVIAGVLIAMEFGCALWVRDNLTLNIIMLIHPVEAIKAWQMAGQPTV